jgi:hypothetical protein
MIRVSIEIDTVKPLGGIMENEFGVGVRVSGAVVPQDVPEGEGATLIGILLAINGYMHSRGAPDFDCTKGLIRRN